jgi:hypothetical protein
MNDTPLPEIETNTGCCLVHKLTKLIWTGKHLADEGGTDGGCHSNDIRTCIYYDIYVSNCFSVSRMLLANHIIAFVDDALARQMGRTRKSESRDIRASDDGTFKSLLHCMVCPRRHRGGGLAAMSLWKFREEASELFLDVLFLDGRS